MKQPKQPFFTILTSSLNSENTIRQTLDSIKNQTFEEFEHIVIDGGSEDGTIDILKKYDKTYELIWISELDDGIADALNKGLAKAKGKYVLVIHSNDRLFAPQTLGTIYARIKDENMDMYAFSIYIEKPDRIRWIMKPRAFLWVYHFKMPFPHQGVFVHRRVFDKNGKYNTRYQIAMDYDFLYRALRRKATVHKENIVVAVMDGEGLGSRDKLIRQRVQEEFAVQNANEKNVFWRILLWFYQRVYPFYKHGYRLSSLQNKD